MTPDLFYEWKKKKIEERDANLAAQQAERAKNDRMRYIIIHSYCSHVNVCIWPPPLNKKW